MLRRRNTSKIRSTSPSKRSPVTGAPPLVGVVAPIIVVARRPRRGRRWGRRGLGTAAGPAARRPRRRAPGAVPFTAPATPSILPVARVRRGAFFDDDGRDGRSGG